jgi:hypothetical protein
MSLANTYLRVTLPSGNAAIYEVQPQHLTKRYSNVSLNQQVIDYARQIAVYIDGTWCRDGKPVDAPTAAAMDRITTAD